MSWLCNNHLILLSRYNKAYDASDQAHVLSNYLLHQSHNADHAKFWKYIDISKWINKMHFPYIWRYPLLVNDHKIKSDDSRVKYDPILERRKIGL